MEKLNGRPTQVDVQGSKRVPSEVATLDYVYVRLGKQQRMKVGIPMSKDTLKRVEALQKPQ